MALYFDDPGDIRMQNPVREGRVAHLVDPSAIEALDVMGPTIQFLTLPDEANGTPCIMRGTIPPDVFVPLHSHPDFETFLAISGEVEGLAQGADGFEWIPIKSGDVFHVPGNVRHAFRNRSQEPSVAIVVSTPTMGRFFRDIGRPVIAGAPLSPPSPQVIRHFLETAERYGHWNATPEENQRIGLSLMTS